MEKWFCMPFQRLPMSIFSVVLFFIFILFRFFWRMYANRRVGIQDFSLEKQFIVGKLAPFFVSVVLYFTILIPYESPSLLAVIIKCTPIASLMYFVISVGFRNRSTCSTRILTGLICCCVGDAFLLWNRYFIYGMLAFTIGHINYILAFGFEPLNLRLGVFLLFLGALVVSFLYEGLFGILIVGVPIYILVINAMVWRAMALIKKPWTWVQFSTCAGSILFALSDCIIGIDKFIRPIAHSQVLIMSSYYAAQLGISLSVLQTTRT